MPKGELRILNVGMGDTKLTFDKKNPQETERAGKVIQDMLKRGYALLVQVGKRKGQPVYQRATGFDPKTNEYIVMGAPDETVDIGATPRKAAKKPQAKRYKAEESKALSVARSAGG